MKQKQPLPVVTIHTDGSCSPNPGIGGWAAVLQHSNYRQELFGGYQWTTNNRMEMIAVVKALDSLTRPHVVLLFSDSTYLVRPIQRNSIKQSIKANDAGKNVKNIDLWRRIHDHTQRHVIKATWIRGHNNDKNNERCDYLANQMRISSPEVLEIDQEYLSDLQHLNARNALKKQQMSQVA